MARRMLRKLLHRHSNDRPIRDELKRNRTTIITAALLHDLGHGPFSHVFERVFRERVEVPLRKHDAWTCRILRDPETEVHQCLSNHLPEKNSSIDDVCSLITYDEPPRGEPYLRDIVSSQLDADRMDYLLRDSLMTGSRFGQFDSEWILNALVIGQIRMGEDRRRKLCLDGSKGSGAIEGFLFARLQMYHYVYGHKTTRAFEAELVQTLRLAIRLATRLPDDTPIPVRTAMEKKGNVSNKEYLFLDDEVLWWALRRWAVWDRPKIGKETALAHTLRDHSLRLVRRLEPWTSRLIEAGEQSLAAEKLHRHLVSEDNPLQYECLVDTLEDLPYRDYQHFRRDENRGTEEGFFREIYVVDRDGVAMRLSGMKNRPVLKAMNEPIQLCRFYFNRKLEQKFLVLLRKFGVS